MNDIDKASLRREVLERRAALDAGGRAAASDRACRTLLGLIGHGPVSVFWPIGDELDTRALLHGLAARAVTPLLPRMQGRGRPLVFHEWHEGMRLEEGPFQVMQPPATAPVARPATVVTPLVAFDRLGRRLGYGAGYYDRSFAELAAHGLRPRRIGLAFACQEVAAVPVGEHDVALDLVVTEAEVVTIDRPRPHTS